MMVVSLLATLIALAPGYHVEADSSSYQTQTRLIELSGHVAVTRQMADSEPAITLRADAIAGRIDGIVEATGHVQVERSNFAADAASGVYDFATATGSFDDVQLTQDSWFIHAGHIAIDGTDRYSLEDARFTACDEIPPHYDFRIGRARWREGFLEIWGARMFVGRIPVFWWPYLSLVPGKKPPFHLSVGKSGYEGYFVKLGFPYGLGRYGSGEIKLDGRSRRGWGYGVEHEFPIRGGAVNVDLYRIDERDRGGRGVARVRYAQDWTDRWRALGDYYYVTDGAFLQDYRFADFASKPDPQATGSVSWRGDAGAAVLRVVGNANRAEYGMMERLPELRLAAWPRPLPGGQYAEANGGLTVFRHPHPYDSGLAALFARQHPQYDPGVNLVRGDAHSIFQRPLSGPMGWRVTPYVGVDLVGWSEDSNTARVSARTMPFVGTSFSRFFRLPLSSSLSWSMKPTIDIQDRSLHGQSTANAPIIEHIDQERDGRPLHIILDQGILTHSSQRGGRWVERLRLRLDGGLDFDRVAADRYLPVVAKANALLGGATHLEGALTFDPNRTMVRDGRLEISHVSERIQGSLGYFLRRGDAGVPDQENVSATLDARITQGAETIRSGIKQGWGAGVGGSYNLELGRLDFASFRLNRYFHDWIIGAELTNQRLTNRTDFKVTAELLLP